MTCVVAAKRGDLVLIGADSLTTSQDRKLVNMSKGSKSKLVGFDNFIVGMSGNGPTREILELMQKEPQCDEEGQNCYNWLVHPMDDTLDVAKFLEKFMELFEERGEAEDMESVELLFITKDKIFCTIAESSVFEMQDFWSVGGGAPYALGSMERTFSSQDLRSSIQLAIETACKYAPGCEKPIEIMALDTVE